MIIGHQVFLGEKFHNTLSHCKLVSPYWGGAFPCGGLGGGDPTMLPYVKSQGNLKNYDCNVHKI
jgi:hypothetical protein